MSTDDNHPERPIRSIPTAPSAGETNSSASVKSALRVLKIYEYFIETQKPARAKDIARALEMPQSSTSVLLRSLLDAGYLDQDPKDRTYMPTPRVTLLGAWIDSGPIRDGRLIHALEKLSEETSVGIFVATRNGIFSQYIYVMQARTEFRHHLPIGSRRLLANSATGFALLSSCPDDEILAITRRTNAELPESALCPADVLKEVEKTRRDGYAFSRGLVTRGAGAIAMPLPGGLDHGHRPLVLSCAGMLEDFVQNEAQIVAAMRHAVARLTPD